MANPDVSSAEWIAEAPSACDASVSSCTPLPLTDFGTVAFTGARAVTTDGHAGTISDADWSTSAVSLSGTASVGGGPQFSSYAQSAGATPGSLSSDGSTFDVVWSASGYGYGGSGYGYGGYAGYGYGDGGYGDGGYAGYAGSGGY